jgi:hypothetical protein
MATDRGRAPGVVMQRRPGGCVPGGDDNKGYLKAWPVPTGWVGVETLPATDQPRDPLSNT